MTLSNGSIFRVTGPLCSEFTVYWWNPLTEASDSRALMFSLMCAWTNDWVTNRDAGDFRRHRVHYDSLMVNQKLARNRMISYMYMCGICVCLCCLSVYVCLFVSTYILYYTYLYLLQTFCSFHSQVIDNRIMIKTKGSTQTQDIFIISHVILIYTQRQKDKLEIFHVQVFLLWSLSLYFLFDYFQ